jgi:hypothetical protein
MAEWLIWTTAGDMRNLNPLEPSAEAIVALARRRLIEHAVAFIMLDEGVDLLLEIAGQTNFDRSLLCDDANAHRHLGPQLRFR